MSISVTVDPKEMTEAEKNQFFEKLKRLAIPMMTPETWKQATGKTEADLAVFIKQNCRIHNIRHFLTGEEQLGRCPKLIVINSEIGNCFYLVSLKPDYPEFVKPNRKEQ